MYTTVDIGGAVAVGHVVPGAQQQRCAGTSEKGTGRNANTRCHIPVPTIVEFAGLQPTRIGVRQIDDGFIGQLTFPALRVESKPGKYWRTDDNDSIVEFCGYLCRSSVSYLKENPPVSRKRSRQR